MQLIVFEAVFLTAVIAILMADLYVKRSMKSFRRAAVVLDDIQTVVVSLRRRGLSAQVSRLVEWTVEAAGCGCFVRSMLMAHYLPGVFVGSPDDGSEIGVAFSEIENSDQDFKKEFSRFLGLIITYDSLRNPFQGWLFRRVITSFRETRPEMNAKMRFEAFVSTASALGKSHAQGRFAH